MKGFSLKQTHTAIGNELSRGEDPLYILLGRKVDLIWQKKLCPNATLHNLNQ